MSKTQVKMLCRAEMNFLGWNAGNKLRITGSSRFHTCDFLRLLRLYLQRSHFPDLSCQPPRDCGSQQICDGSLLSGEEEIKNAPFGTWNRQRNDPWSFFLQDQGSSIVDGINHLRNLLLSIDLFLWEFASTLDSLLFCIFILTQVCYLFKLGCSIRIDAKSYGNWE